MHTRQMWAGVTEMFRKAGPGPGQERGPTGAPQSHTDNDSIHLAVLLCRAGLQCLMDLVCGQVKEVQVIFHGVAIPQPISQADNSYTRSRSY